MRNFLFVPGNSPKMLSAANFLGSDAVVIDLEDAVAPSEKDAARLLARNAILTLCYQIPFGVRINALDTPYWEKDLQTILPLNPAFIMLPKTSNDISIFQLETAMVALEASHGISRPVPIIALLETAEGIENAYHIAKASCRVQALFLGAEDLTADLCAQRTKESTEIFYSRSRLVNAARAAGIDAYDTPFTDVEDLEGLEKDARFARQLGFSGKAAINPRHIHGINMAFTPTEAEIRYAEEVVAIIEKAEKEGLGAVSLHGKMIDVPIVARAKQILQIVQNA